MWTATHTITRRRAAVRPHPTNAALLLAQFSDLDHPHSHGWWSYARDRFEPRQAETMFNPAEGSPQTALQMAAVMLLKGTPEQGLEALHFLRGKAL
jgi:hypothetical protein